MIKITDGFPAKVHRKMLCEELVAAFPDSKVRFVPAHTITSADGKSATPHPDAVTVEGDGVTEEQVRAAIRSHSAEKTEDEEAQAAFEKAQDEMLMRSPLFKRLLADVEALKGRK